MIEIWQPKWKTHEVLIACHKVSRGKNLIKFTKVKAYPDIYELDGDAIMSCPVQSNGRIDCYAVPLYMLKVAKDTNEAQEEQSTPQIIVKQLSLGGL